MRNMRKRLSDVKTLRGSFRGPDDRRSQPFAAARLAQRRLVKALRQAARLEIENQLSN